MSDRDRLIEDLLGRYRKVLDRRLPRDASEPKTLDEIEDLSEEIGQDMHREVERLIIEQREGPPENQARCGCGATARYRSCLARVVITRHGELTLRRRYYYCPSCQRGFAPLDDRLGLDQEATTRRVREWCALLGGHLPFAEGAVVLERLTGVRLGMSTLERTTVAVGSRLRAAEQAEARRHHAGQLRQPVRKPSRLYISIDGKMTPLRDPWKRDGSQGPLVCRWGEAKIGVLYEARRGRDGRDAGVRRKAYVATLGDVNNFTPLIATLAHQQGHHWAKELIVLGDGAAWIWLLAASQFPEAIQIVDFYHASEHLWTLANARFGDGSPAVKAWVSQRQEELKRDEILAVLRAIAGWKPRSAAGKKLRRTQFRYFRTNAERMRYGTFQRHGYHIASGVVEAACKHVVGARLDQAGMHWCPETAEAILALRAALCSTQWPDLRPYCASPG